MRKLIYFAFSIKAALPDVYAHFSTPSVAYNFENAIELKTLDFHKCVTNVNVYSYPFLNKDHNHNITIKKRTKDCRKAKKRIITKMNLCVQ